MFVLAIVVVAAVAHLTFAFCFGCFVFCFACLCFVWLQMKNAISLQFQRVSLFLSQTRFLQNPSLISLFPLFFCRSLFKQFFFFGLAQGCFLLLFFFLMFTLFSSGFTCCCFENQRSYELQPKAIIVFIKAFFSRMSEV